MATPGAHRASWRRSGEVSTSRLDRVRALVAATLPGESQTALLRACLWRGERGAAAWRAWLERTADPIGGLDGARTLMPLLAGRAGEEGESAELRTLIKAAYVRERSRHDTYRRIAAPALSALAARAVEPVVLKGAALAGSVYVEPWLRHCHDVDLLVPRSRLADAVSCVAAAGFRRLPAGDAGAHHLAFEHESGLPLRLHAEPFLPGVYAQADAFAAAAVAGEVCGVPARVLPPAAALVHVCGHASYHRAGERLRWVCDAWSLVDRTEDLDWDAAVALAAQARLALPLSVQVEYLAGSLDAPIPAGVLAALRRTPVSAADVRAAELGALCGSWRDVARALALVRPAARIAALTRLVPHVLVGSTAATAGFPLPSIRTLLRAGA